MRDRHFLTSCYCKASYLQYLSQIESDYKIFAQHFSSTSDTIKFSIIEKHTGQLYVKTAQEISENKTMLKGFNQTDLNVINYVLNGG